VQETSEPLSPKQRLFVQEYIIDLNATQAAIRAGYSEKTAKEIGYENLTKPHIAEKVQEAMDLRSRRTEITADKVLVEIGKLAFSNSKNLYDDEGKLIPIQDLPVDVAASIQEITQKSLGSDEDAVVFERKYKTADKKSSLELLGKHLVLFTDKIEHGGDLTVTKIERVIVDAKNAKD
jgi:phage terminase small subunit